MSHILCWGVPLNTLIEDKVHYVIENVVLDNFKSFFQLNHQVYIYLTKATTLRYSRVLALLASQSLESISSHFIGY